MSVTKVAPANSSANSAVNLRKVDTSGVPLLLARLDAERFVRAKAQLEILRSKFSEKLNAPVSETQELMESFLANTEVKERLGSSCHAGSQHFFDISSKSFNTRLAALFDATSASNAEELESVFANRLTLLKFSATQFFLWCSAPTSFLHNPIKLSPFKTGEEKLMVEPRVITGTIRQQKQEFLSILNSLEQSAKEAFPEAFILPTKK